MLLDTSSVSDCSSTKFVATLVFHLATDFVFSRKGKKKKKESVVSGIEPLTKKLLL